MILSTRSRLPCAKCSSSSSVWYVASLATSLLFVRLLILKPSKCPNPICAKCCAKRARSDTFCGFLEPCSVFQNCGRKLGKRENRSER